MLLLSIFLIVLSYLFGSINSAIIISKIFQLPDPRAEGSKNPGATNVLRLASKKHAAIVLIADGLKGTIPILIAKSLTIPPFAISCCVLSAVIGHLYPVFFQFKGGKGVATTLGALLAFSPITALFLMFIWFCVAFYSQYSSLASIFSIAAAPFLLLFTDQTTLSLVPIFIMSFLVIQKHQANIERLIKNQEPKIKKTKKQ